jgi:hypothetical protein
MERPEWDPVVVLAQTKRLSGPIPACAAFLRPRDQVMSPLWLAPSPAALTTVPPGHGLEIPMAFWGATRAMGTSQGSIASIPMGARCGADPTPTRECQDTRRCERQLVRHPVNSMRRTPSSCRRCINLTRAFSWVLHKGWLHELRRIVGQPSRLPGGREVRRRTGFCLRLASYAGTSGLNRPAQSGTGTGTGIGTYGGPPRVHCGT